MSVSSGSLLVKPSLFMKNLFLTSMCLAMANGRTLGSSIEACC